MLAAPNVGRVRGHDDAVLRRSGQLRKLQKRIKLGGLAPAAMIRCSGVPRVAVEVKTSARGDAFDAESGVADVAGAMP